jgi:hypothetical protein
MLRVSLVRKARWGAQNKASSLPLAQQRRGRPCWCQPKDKTTSFLGLRTGVFVREFYLRATERALSSI